MFEQSLSIDLISPGFTDYSTSRLRQEYVAHQRLFQSQNTLAQQYMNVQAATVTRAIDQGYSHLQFTLPDAVVCPPVPGGRMEEETIPPDARQQFVGRRIGLVKPSDLLIPLCRRLAQLEGSANRAISVSAELLRYAIATHMVYNMLPSGRSVIYESVEDDDIPNHPARQDSAADTLVRHNFNRYDGSGQSENNPDELMVPYVEAARRFYLPQWVAFDDHGNLLLGAVGEAEACLTSMQHYLAILNDALVIAPYMVADEALQQKRYGMLGQLVNQGRAFARYQSGEIINKIKRRVAEHKLDRGLSLSLPYFNDQSLALESYDFTVIPTGRIMFVPAFVVLAVRQQGAKVAQDTHYSLSTRRHLLMQLSKFEQAFSR